MSTLPKEVKKLYKQISQIYIEYGRVTKIFDNIETARQLFGYSIEPECFLVQGISGVGKSSIAEIYVADHPRRRTKSGVRVPVLHAIIPKPTTLKSVITHLLRVLGDPLAGYGNTTEKKDRLIKFLGECKVEIILLDEFQHLLDVDCSIVSDWLKVLIEESKIPVILFGLPECEQVLQENIQLNSRFSSRLVLEPFKWDSENSRKEFEEFITAFDEQMPFSGKSELVTYADKIFYASDGISRSAIRLIKRAALNALLRNRNFIAQEDLAMSYSLVLQSLHANKENPFRDNFDTSLLESNEYLDHLERKHYPTQGITSRIKKRKKKVDTFSEMIR